MKLYHVSIILLALGGFFGQIPIVLAIFFKINYLMEEFLRMSMISFFLLGSGVTLLVMIWHLKKYKLERIE